MADSSRQVAAQAEALSQVAAQARETALVARTPCRETVAGMERIQKYVHTHSPAGPGAGSAPRPSETSGPTWRPWPREPPASPWMQPFKRGWRARMGKASRDAAPFAVLPKRPPSRPARAAHLLRSVQDEMVQVQQAMSETTRETERGAQQAQQTGRRSPRLCHGRAAGRSHCRHDAGSAGTRAVLSGAVIAGHGSAWSSLRGE